MYIYLSEVSLGLSLTNKHPSKSIYCPSPPIPPKCHKEPEIPIKSPKTCPIPCYLHRNVKKTVAHPLPYQKNSLPLHSLSEREHITRSLKDCEQEEKDKAALLEREQPSDVNSYRNNKRIKQERLAGQTRASWAARTYI